MKNKVAIFLCCTALFISLFSFIPSYASYYGPLDSWSFIAVGRLHSNGKYYVGYASSPVYWYWSSGFQEFSGSDITFISSYNGGPSLMYNSMGEAIAAAAAYRSSGTSIGQGGGGTFDQVVVIKGTLNISNAYPQNTYWGSLDDYNDYLESIQPKWYETLWQDFVNFITDFLPDLATPGNPASLTKLAEWLQDSFTVNVGEGEDDLANQIFVSPLPTPTPTPTPIPYQTVMSPDGNGGYSIQYIYNNPSGTPIITSQPPQQNVSIDVDNNFEYPYYENPENKDNPFKFKIPWYLKLVLKNNDIDIDTLDNTYQSAQGLVQDDDVITAVDEVYNGFQVLPSSWLLLIGAIASLPLFAALIRRFLGG